MNRQKRRLKINSLLQLYELLPEQERIIVDVLRQLVLSGLPDYCKEKISFNVPFFYGNKGICIIWPAAIPGGGVKSGVLLGFWYGHKLKDEAGYLTHGTNKKVYYIIFNDIHEIEPAPILLLLQEAIRLDQASSH